MQLSDDLDALLCTSYPTLFGARHTDPSYCAMGQGFQIGPGWFALIDELSASLSLDPRLKATQIKSKFGTLRLGLDGTLDSPLPVELAVCLSARVCEISGRPGRLCRYRPTWFATLAPGVRLPERQGVPTPCPSVLAPDNRKSYIPPIGFTLDEMVTVRADVIAGPVDIPVGWYDLADSILQTLQIHCGEARVRRMWVADDCFRMEWHGGGAGSEALSAMAASLSLRTDQMTGEMT